MKGKDFFEKLEGIREDFIQDTANSLYGEEERNEETGEGKKKLFHGGWMHGIRKKPGYLFCGAAAVVVLLAGTVYAKGRFWAEDKKQLNSAEKKQDKKLVYNEEKDVQELPEGEVDMTKIKKGGASAGKDSAVYQVQPVSYPEQIDWHGEEEGWKPERSYLKSLKNFYQEFFKGTLISETQENTVCSPINLYFCMAMLTEMTSGETQSELLDALGQDSVETVREQSQKIWSTVYEDNEISKCTLGNSIWLNQDIPFQQDILKTVSDNYYASTYQGEMGTPSMDSEIQNWVNDMTGDALKKQAEGIVTEKDTAAVLLSTAYFYDQWMEPFLKESTKSAVFYNADGSETECDFMKQTDMGKSIYRKKDFTSISLGFENQKSMWIFLPNEGVTVDALLEKDMADILHVISDYKESDKDREYAEVTIKLPKFQIETGEVDLIPTMRKMGVKNLFEADEADFTRLVGKEKKDTYKIYASKAVQASRAAVDENGCSVASYTEVELRCGAGMPKKRKKYTVDCNRPFLFVIGDSYYRIPVFAGVVNDMN